LPEPRPLRGAVLGLGGIARHGHLAALMRDPSLAAKVEYVASFDPVSATTPVPGLPLVHTLEELEKLGPFDFVDICSPSSTHLPLARWALARGWHVLCEKPVATTAAEAGELGALARAANRVLFPCHQYRYNPAWEWMRARLDEGAIGRWHLAEFQVWRLQADRGAAAGTTAPWRARRDGGGGVLVDHGTHLLYLVLDVAGPPVAVHSWMGRLRHHDYDVEDTAHVLLEYPSRAVTLFLTWAGQHRENRIRFVGEQGLLEWNGGWVTLEAPGRSERVDFSAQLDKAAYADWFGRVFHDFVDAVRTGTIEPGLAEITGVADLIERATEGQRVGAAG
jgi:predicted dehydrogenase